MKYSIANEIYGINDLMQKQPWCLIEEEIYCLLEMTEHYALHMWEGPSSAGGNYQCESELFTSTESPMTRQRHQPHLYDSSVMCEDENQQNSNISRIPQGIKCSVPLLPIKNTNPHIMRPSHKEKKTLSSGILKNNLRHPVYIFVRVVCIRSHLG
jgi:hypothetical protein